MPQEEKHNFRYTTFFTLSVIFEKKSRKPNDKRFVKPKLVPKDHSLTSQIILCLRSSNFPNRLSLLSCISKFWKRKSNLQVTEDTAGYSRGWFCRVIESSNVPCKWDTVQWTISSSQFLLVPEFLEAAMNKPRRLMHFCSYNEVEITLSMS